MTLFSCSIGWQSHILDSPISTLRTHKGLVCIVDTFFTDDAHTREFPILIYASQQAWDYLPEALGMKGFQVRRFSQAQVPFTSRGAQSWEPPKATVTPRLPNESDECTYVVTVETDRAKFLAQDIAPDLTPVSIITLGLVPLWTKPKLNFYIEIKEPLTQRTSNLTLTAKSVQVSHVLFLPTLSFFDFSGRERQIVESFQ